MDFIKKAGVQKLLALGALIILWVFFAIFGNNFASSATGLNILASAYYVGFLALGVTFVIITGGIDLSIGAVMMCSALIGGQAFTKWGVPLVWCIPIIIAVGTLFGWLNGYLVTKLKLPPFIATLGTMMIALGGGSIITNTTSKYYPTIADPEAWFIRLFYKTDGGFPCGAIFLLVFYILAMIILNKTKIGRYIYAIGSNEEATRLSGINVNLYKCVAYIIGGFFAGLGAIFYAATYTVVIPNTGNGIELLAIAGVVIGGTSLSGGVGSLTGTIIGVFIMSVLKNGLVSMGLPAPYQQLFTGIVVIGAVLLDIYRNKEKSPKKNNPALKCIVGILILALICLGVYFGVQKHSSKAGGVKKDLYISVVAKGFQHQFWQAVKSGADDASKDLGVKIYFLGPEGESAQASQLDMINSELAKNPDAICMAPLNIDSVISQVKDANSKNIPVVMFDSGIPQLPEGKIQGTASTDNEKAAGIGAEHLYEAIKSKITGEAVTVAVLSQDVTSASIQGRTKGFAEKLYELVQVDGKTACICGAYSDINKGSQKGADVIIKIVTGASADIADVTNAANGILNTKGLVGLFCSNEGTVNGYLASLNAGTKKPDGLVVVGYDAGSGQKNAVKKGEMLGSVTQDPYEIGYQVVKLAKDICEGQKGEDIDTGAKWYDKDNMDEPDIAKLLYD